jgi:hypothetical protein
MFLILLLIGILGMVFIFYCISEIQITHSVLKKYPRITKEELEVALKCNKSYFDNNLLFLFNVKDKELENIYLISKLDFSSSAFNNFITNNFDFINSNYIISISNNPDNSSIKLIPPYLNLALDKLFKENHENSHKH